MSLAGLVRFIAVCFSTLMLWVLMGLPAIAQEEGSTTIRQEQATTGVTDEGEAEDVDISEDTAPIGIVDEIIITGELSTSERAVLDQMTFVVGDQISPRDIDLCRRRLLSLNGIYWYADITWEPSPIEGHIIVTIDLASRRTWFLSPSLAGGVIGDRNFMGSADQVTLAVFIADGNSYYSVSYLDPQFQRGHNSLMVQLRMLDTYQSVRTDTLYGTGEGYTLDRTGFTIAYGTRWNEDIGVTAGFRWDDVNAEKAGDSFGYLGTDDHYFYTGSDIPDGKVGLATLTLASGALNSRHFPTEGHYWILNNEISTSLTFSDFDFSRHTFTGLYFTDIGGGRNVLGTRMIYSYLIGDPPYYELLPFDWQVRGYTGGTHRGKSLLALNFEYRFILLQDYFQGVLFADFGRAWDKRGFGLDGLESGYGIGLRAHTRPFVPYDLLLRVDYGWGEYGEELLVGLNHFF